MAVVGLQLEIYRRVPYNRPVLFLRLVDDFMPKGRDEA